MATYELRRKQWVPHPLEQVFQFFSEAKNLERLTPSFLHFEITHSPPRMERGAQIEYKLLMRGFPIGWRTIIEEWDPPHSFVDVQAKGPYKLWHHTHRFRADGGGTWIEDEVRYRLPFGVLGRLVRSVIVKRDVEKIFSYREQNIREIFP